MERSPKRFKNGTIKAQRGVWDIEANEEPDRQHSKQGPATRGGRELGGQEEVSMTSNRELGSASRRMVEGQNETLRY